MSTQGRARARRLPAWAYLVAGPLLSLILFVITYYVDPLNFGGREPLAALPAFLLAVVILLITHLLETHRELAEASVYSDRIYEAVKDYLHVTKVGSPEAAFEYVLARTPILTEVRNTSFNLPTELERPDEKFYATGTYAHALRAIAAGCSKGLHWKDIGDGRGVSRLRHLMHLCREAAGRHDTHYQYRLITHAEPQLNFMLLGYADGSVEALFNWDYRSIGNDPIVLLSRDRDIVNMFTVQFEHLWRAASPDHDSKATKSTPKK